MFPKLGIIAGAGEIPAHLIEACRAEGRDFFVLAFKGHAEPEMIGDAPCAWVRLGSAGAGFKILHEENVKDVIMIGGIKRPSLADLKPDWRAAKFFAKVGYKLLGDDSLLSAVVKEFESEGFNVIGVDEILKNLLAEEGIYGRIKPDEQAEKDISHGVKIAKGIGALDIGQAVVIQEGIVLGVEAVEGTDALLKRAGELKRKGLGGVLVKVKKPEQERRVDLPTIGVSTIKNAAAAGLRGIAIEADNALVVNKKAITECADSLGLFVVGIKLEE